MEKTYKNLRDELLKDPELKAEYDALGPEYELIRELIDLRIEKKLTQDELSKRIGIPKSNISRFESRKHSPTLDTLNRFAKGLGKRVELKLVDNE